MIVDRHERLRRLFDAAVDLPPEDRAAYLHKRCGDDVELRREVEELLIAHVSPTSPLIDTPQSDGQDVSHAFSLLGKNIGRYRIRRIIASGGMGTVYEAVQESPRRTVALKVMQHGISSRSSLRRFEYEAQILARLRHPGIAQVYEAGTHDDERGSLPYFAMEYVPNAKTITEYAKVHNLPIRQRLELFAKVCDAVHHGHQKGIIHRDLKPGNILVDSHGQPKVIDFGVARAADADLVMTTLQTDVGQLIGTLQYMSPEQCDADPHDLDARSDVYALGVVLYELLCEQVPYDLTKVAVYEVARVIRETPPTKPSSINRVFRGDVETIALKALEKDRGRRYRSAAELADDIHRHLNGEAVLARPPSHLYRLTKTYAKFRTPIFAALAGAGTTVLLFVSGRNLVENIHQSVRPELIGSGLILLGLVVSAALLILAVRWVHQRTLGFREAILASALIWITSVPIVALGATTVHAFVGSGVNILVLLVILGVLAQAVVHAQTLRWRLRTTMIDAVRIWLRTVSLGLGIALMALVMLVATSAIAIVFMEAAYATNLRKDVWHQEAEVRLLESFTLFEENFGTSHQLVNEMRSHIIDLYDLWHAAEPDSGRGYDLKAAKWRAKLAALHHGNGTSPTVDERELERADP